MSNLDQSVKFWKDLLDMKVVSLTDNEVVLNYDPDTQTNLRLISTCPKGTPVDHATAFGRIAFSLPTNTLPALETKINEGGLGKVKTPLVVLDTPGKADVQVVILEDPVSTPRVLHTVHTVGIIYKYRDTSNLDMTSFFK